MKFGNTGDRHECCYINIMYFLLNISYECVDSGWKIYNLVYDEEDYEDMLTEAMEQN